VHVTRFCPLGVSGALRHLEHTERRLEMTSSSSTTHPTLLRPDAAPTPLCLLPRLAASLRWLPHRDPPRSTISPRSPQRVPFHTRRPGCSRTACLARGGRIHRPSLERWCSVPSHWVGPPGARVGVGERQRGGQGGLTDHSALSPAPVVSPGYRCHVFLSPSKGEGLKNRTRTRRLTLRALCLPVRVGNAPLGTSSTRARTLSARQTHNKG
jgi:hypothetical protein